MAEIVLANSDRVDDGDEGGEAGAGTSASGPTSTGSPRSRRPPCASALADKVHNARSILVDYRTLGDDLWARFGQGQGLATRVYYRELAAAFERERGRMGEAAGPYVDELRRVVDAITALAEEHQGPDRRALFDA